MKKIYISLLVVMTIILSGCSSKDEIISEGSMAIEETLGKTNNIEDGAVAHKIGNYYRYYHDIGIVYGENPYILAILTKDIGELSNEALEDGGEEKRYLLDWGDKGCELIAQLSKEIYTIVEENKM